MYKVKVFLKFAVFMPLSLAMACGSVSPSSLIALSRLDPLETPPGDVAIAISVPDALVLADGDAVLRISFADERNSLVDTAVPLTIRENEGGVAGLQQDGANIFVGALAEAEARNLAAAQAEIRDLRAAGQVGQGTVQIQVRGGCWVGAPLDALPVATWFRGHPDAAFLPITRETDILGRLEAGGFEIPVCE